MVVLGVIASEWKPKFLRTEKREELKEDLS
jgi:hypothetical protein